MFLPSGSNLESISNFNFILLILLQIYSEIIIVKRRLENLNKQDVSEMHLLMATLYESARLLPAGPLLQRCSLKHGTNYFAMITV